MPQAKKTYNSKKDAPAPLLSSLSTGCITPVLPIKFSTLVNAYYYPNSKTIGRYSLVCVLDPKVHKDFLDEIQSIEKQEGVATTIKNEMIKIDGENVNTGNVLFKFQTKDKIPVYQEIEDGSQVPLTLAEEFDEGEEVCVVFDILRYTKKNTMTPEMGITFKPTKIIHHPK